MVAGPSRVVAAQRTFQCSADLSMGDTRNHHVFYSPAMPYITFGWTPNSDTWRVGPIVDDLRLRPHMTSDFTCTRHRKATVKPPSSMIASRRQRIVGI